jgi:acyl carrier protein
MNGARENQGELSTRERLLNLVRQILEEQSGPRPLPIDARLNDLGMTSIKMIKLMLAVEMEFDLAIPQADITPENFVSVASIEAMVVRLRAGSERDPG